MCSAAAAVAGVTGVIVAAENEKKRDDNDPDALVVENIAKAIIVHSEPPITIL